MRDTHSLDFSGLPDSAKDFIDWPWETVQPYYTCLLERPLTPETISAWLADWSRLAALVSEATARLNRAAYANTDDETARQRLQRYFQTVGQPARAADQQLQERWLASGIPATGYERILARLRAKKSLYCAANQPLEAREGELVGRYFQLMGAWGLRQREKPGAPDAEGLWRKVAARRMEDRAAVNSLWGELVALRQQMAVNAGFPNFLEYQWARMQRDDYTPADCAGFHSAVEKVVVPAASRVLERRRMCLGAATLRPWDVSAALPGAPDLLLFNEPAQLVAGCSRIFHHIDPALGRHFDTLQSEGILDLEPRPNKFPGGFSLIYAVTRQVFILLNLASAHDDVIGLIHEAGHAFAIMETAQRSFLQMVLASGEGGGERREFTSLALELLALPYLSARKGGFYSDEQAAWADARYMEDWVLLFLCQAAVMDAFQHWLYTHPLEAARPENCDAAWLALQLRFFPSIDGSGLEAERATGWQEQGMFFTQPLFFIEYALALLAALQVCQRPDGPAAYRRALAIGGTGAGPREFYAAAGAVFAMDEPALAAAVRQAEARIEHYWG